MYIYIYIFSDTQVSFTNDDSALFIGWLQGLSWVTCLKILKVVLAYRCSSVIH